MKPERVKRVRTGLKALREAANKTQAQLAYEVGVAEKAVRSWENDGAIPSFDKAVKVARILKVSLERLAQEFELDTEGLSTKQADDTLTTSAPSGGDFN